MLLGFGGTERPGASCDWESHGWGSTGIVPPFRWTRKRLENNKKLGMISRYFGPIILNILCKFFPIWNRLRIRDLALWIDARDTNDFILFR